MANPIPHQADGVFEGGGVKGAALAGAVDAAEQDGITEWKNVAGASAGAIVASLLAVGYTGAQMKEKLDAAGYPSFADFGRGGKVRGFANTLWARGMAPGRYFTTWFERLIAESPLAKRLGRPELTFADMRRDDLPEDLSPELRRRALYRLRVIGADITAGRMLVLPDDIEGYRESPRGAAYTPDTLPIARAVRMSMSYPFFFTPVTLYDEKRRPHYIVDGGLLSNFPIWLFDSGDGRRPARPTWGFRLHGGVSPEEPLPYRAVPLPFWRMKMARAMLLAVSEAWDRRHMSTASQVRTVSIPTRDVSTMDFGLTREQSDALFRWGAESWRSFLARPETRRYLEGFRPAAASNGASAEPTERREEEATRSTG